MSIRSFLFITSAASLLAGCAGGSYSAGSSGPQFIIPSSYVDPDMANACIAASASKYYLPARVIKAMNTRAAGDGLTQVIMKVDLRDAVCTVDASGNVRSVVDTTPPRTAD